MIKSLILLVIFLYLFRFWLLNKKLPAAATSEFDGALFMAGETVIAVREAAADNLHSILCFPGFLEDMRYFQALYHNTEAQLILINNAGSHSPFTLRDVQMLDWQVNPYDPGSIEYDGFYLAQAVQHIATGQYITLHGHSRGGAVVLEAGRQYPEVMSPSSKGVRAILEAAVLPGGKVAGNLNGPITHKIALFFIPMVCYLSRWASTGLLLKLPVMRPTNALKMQLYKAMFWTLKSYQTCVTSAYSIGQWPRQHAASLYQNYASIVVLVGERDDVLDKTSMLESAEQGKRLNSGVRIVQTQNTNHMISLEQPETVRRRVFEAEFSG
ncbi:MAG: pimeloyl-ACP methyl ester carboxylesterase [Alcanivorax sp.]|jgi:pimeloyl-ACP methyl ester carboxylesterase